MYTISLPGRRSIGREPETDIQSLIHPFLVLRCDLPGPLPQAVLIQRADLLQQHHAVLGKAGVRRPDVDVGGQARNLKEVLAAGANVIVAGSAIFKGDITKNVEDFLEVFKDCEVEG